MNLTEFSPLLSAELPLAEFSEHMRLGSGFIDDGAQNTLLESCLRAAMGAIEARTKKILITRRFNLILSTWRLEAGAQALPISPVTTLIQLKIYEQDGSFEVILPSQYGLLNDGQRPRLFPKTGGLPQIAPNGYAQIIFFAGFGDWSKVPADLRQAMLMLAASYYENRDAMVSGAGQMPFGVAALIEPYKRFRLGGAP